MLEKLTHTYCHINDFILAAQKSPNVQISYKKSRGTKP